MDPVTAEKWAAVGDQLKRLRPLKHRQVWSDIVGLIETFEKENEVEARREEAAMARLAEPDPDRAQQLAGQRALGPRLVEHQAPAKGF